MFLKRFTTAPSYIQMLLYIWKIDIIHIVYGWSFLENLLCCIWGFAKLSEIKVFKPQTLKK